MEIESYKTLNQLTLGLKDMMVALPEFPDSNQLKPLYDVFEKLRIDLLSTLQKDLAKVIPVDLALKNEEFFPMDDRAQGLCYCYYRFNIIGEADSFLVVRLLPFYKKILLHIKEPVSVKGFPKKLNKAFIHNPISLSELT